MSTPLTQGTGERRWKKPSTRKPVEGFIVGDAEGKVGLQLARLEPAQADHMPERAADGARETVAAIRGEGHPAFRKRNEGNKALASIDAPQAHGGVHGAGCER